MSMTYNGQMSKPDNMVLEPSNLFHLTLLFCADDQVKAVTFEHTYVYLMQGSTLEFEELLKSTHLIIIWSFRNNSQDSRNCQFMENWLTRKDVNTKREVKGQP